MRSADEALTLVDYRRPNPLLSIAVDVFYKETPGGVDLFLKKFDKQRGWSKVETFPLNLLKITGLDGAEASFESFDKDRGVFFMKFLKLNVGVVTTFENGAEGVRFDVQQVSLNND